MAAVENEHGYVEGSSLDGPRLAPYPPYVQTEEERRRWDAAYGIAAGASALYEEDGRPDSRFTWLSTRALYTSDAPTGPELEEAELEEARIEPLGGPVDRPGLAPAHQRAHELLSAGEAAHDLGAHELAMDFAADALDVLFGDPDAIPDWPLEVRESALALPHPYNASMHPKGRAGRWIDKLGGLAHAAHGKYDSLETSAIVHANDALMAFGQPHAGHGRSLPKAARAASDAGRIAHHAGVPIERAHAAMAARGHGDDAPAPAAVAKSGLRGGLPTGRAMALVHTALVAPNPLDKAAEHFEAKGGRHNQAVAVAGKATSAYVPDPRDTMSGKVAGVAASDLQDDVDRMSEAAKKSLEAARWAHEHAGELRVAGHVIGHAARALGLWAARFEDER